MISKITNFFNSKTLIIFIIIAFILRFWGLGNFPPSLYWDEVSQGYNSYSILKTGHDEHNELFPIARFEAFGDYKAPVYIYLDVIAIAIFGQTEFAVRLPSALFGTLSVLIVYFLVKEIFKDEKEKKFLALSASFFLAISPWHIQLSRAAYEANIATFFTLLALLLFFLSLNKQKLLIILSSVSFVIAFYSFNAHRIFIPLIAIFLGFLYLKPLLKIKKQVYLAIGIGIFMLIPFLIYFRSPESKLRFQEVNIFSDISQIELSNRLIESDNNSLIGKIIHNRRVLYALSYVKHYFDFQNPSYLFFKGDQNPRFSTQENGELYLFMLPLILVGIYKILKTNGKNRLFLTGWFLLAPVAAATARETPHALRSETFIPIYEIFASVGFVYFYNFFKGINRKVLYSFIVFCTLVVCFSVLNFLHMYFIHMGANYSQDWQYGYKQAVKETESLKNNYDHIIFTNAYGRAYIYVLWYGGYSPEKFWEGGNVKKDSFGFYNVLGFGKYIFNSPSNEKLKDRTLVVSTPEELPRGLNIIKNIYFLDGTTAFVIAEKI